MMNLHPEWMIKYGGKYYYNPALPEVQTHLMNIVDEVVTKYDAIHFDDLSVSDYRRKFYRVLQTIWQRLKQIGGGIM
jgi:uncharacterized lipoprotein YddW (UPF0748 family)